MIIQSDCLSILRLFTRRNYRLYERPYELNLLGVRNMDKKLNLFNEQVGCMYKDEAGNWRLELFPGTTKPGLYYLRNLLNPKGTAILVPDQYADSYAIGRHQNKYEAFVQVKPVSVYRDKNRNDVIDLHTLETGLFGINIHRANALSVATAVNSHSAGCQVINHPKDFARLMELAKIHLRRYGNRFTYTLICEKDVFKESFWVVVPKPLSRISNN